MRKIEDPSAPRSVRLFREEPTAEVALPAVPPYRRAPPRITEPGCDVPAAVLIQIDYRAVLPIGGLLFVTVWTGLAALAALHDPSAIWAVLCGVVMIAVGVMRICEPRTIAAKAGVLHLGEEIVDLRDIKSVRLIRGAFSHEIWLETARSTTPLLLLNQVSRLEEARYVATLVAREADAAKRASRQDPVAETVVGVW